MGKHVDNLIWSKFPNEPTAEGAKWVKLDGVLRAVAKDEENLEQRFLDRCSPRRDEK